MIITTLVENNRLPERDDLATEKGLSLHIQYAGKNILFDTGVKGAIINNARRLNVDLSTVDFAVISHHHFDHGGGLPDFLDVNSKAPVYMRGRRGESHYFRSLLGFSRYVGLDEEMFTKYPDRFQFVDQLSEISPGVFILTEMGSSYSQPRGNRLLYLKKGNAWSPDPFYHELIMVIEEGDGLVVFTGCGHSGILNMVEAATRQFPDKPIKAVLGGFHQILFPQFNFMAGSKGEVASLGRSILEFPVEMVYTGHCTGLKAYQVLKEVMGDRLAYLLTGCVIEI